ncbi:endonuclease NucS domain-containing protein [Mycobacterium sp. ACS4331]|uniref:endonuclease NucS domain-containing protein n=1 Tax=Mycobacterium sp. ACS4331 TaxID=1834121 RepID=UPI00080125D6|nr:hypothetical protein A5727_23185 [Mycobacterium sp. ACS4331]
MLFPTEFGLSDFLERNFAALSYVRKNGLRLRGREVRIAAGCIVDLLAEDKKTRELVGIELKHAAPDQGIVAQSTKYMDALRAQAEKEGRPGARLLIVTGQPDRNLHAQAQELAAIRGVQMTWLLYRVSVELSEAP